jgi:hypothetical protein
MSVAHSIGAPLPFQCRQLACVAAGRWCDELFAASPNLRRVIAQVEATSELHRRAAVIDASDPMRVAHCPHDASRHFFAEHPVPNHRDTRKRDSRALRTTSGVRHRCS